MSRSAASAARGFGTRSGSRVAGFVLFVAAVAAACGTSPTAPPAGPRTPDATASPNPMGSVPIPTPARTPAGPPAESATPRASVVAATPKSFWAAVARGLAAAKHLQVTIAGPNAGVLRFEPGASATIVDGRVEFVCLDGAAFDGQSGFARVPGAWGCGAAALSGGFRNIGQPADAWNATSPTDSAITEVVGVAPAGTWTWAYVGVSAFSGGRVTARVSLDVASGRILAARRTDPAGITTYMFDYAVTFPALAVPR
jgi:hypothetical protein